MSNSSPKESYIYMTKTPKSPLKGKMVNTQNIDIKNQINV